MILNMKKYVFFALFACATLAFVGCEPTPNQPQDETKVVITVTPDTLLMGVGDTEKLTAVVTPATTQLTVTWTSTDESVITVAPSGIILATGIGTANVIASAEGATADTCFVTVSNDALYEAYAFSDYGFFGEKIEMVPNSEGYVSFTSGDSALCQVGYVTLGVWGTDAVAVGGYLTGADNVLFVQMPMYVLVDQSPEWVPYYGQLVGGGGFYIDEIADDVVEPYVGKAGALVDVQSYGDFFKQDIANMYDETVAVDANLYLNSFNGGAEMCFINYDEQYSTYNTATVKYAEFYDTAEGLAYYAEIEWLDYLNEGRWFGLAVEMDEEGYPTQVVEPYDVRIIPQICTNVVLEETPAQAQAKKGQHYIINPERVHIGKDINTVLSTVKMYKK